MNIRNILSEMNVDYEAVGDTDFDTLGLVSSITNGRVCTFIDSAKYARDLSPDISVIILQRELGDVLSGYGLVFVNDPRIVFFKLHNHLAGNKSYLRTTFKTKIGSNCSISEYAHIAEKNVLIGNNVTIEEFVSIKPDVVIGDNCIIRAGTIVGGQGFEHKRFGDEILSVAHLGGVIIGNNVEIQQINAIDKAIYPWDNTEIGDWCKTDNFVHIAHGVKMMKRVLVAAQTCIAGRVTIEDDVWIGPGVTLINGMRIGKGARVNIGSVATRDVPDGGAVTGNFALEHGKFLRNLKEWNRD